MTNGEPETASLQKIKLIKNPIKHFFFFFSFFKSETSDSFVNHFDGHFAYLKTLDFYFNTSIVLAEIHGLSGLFRAVSAVEPSLSRPLPSLSLPSPPPPPPISNLASVDVKQNVPDSGDFHFFAELHSLDPKLSRSYGILVLK